MRIFRILICLVFLPLAYTVKNGDTLWELSGRFLDDPFKWPEIWNSNPQISNPDLIYPGREITLAMAEGPASSIEKKTNPPFAHKVDFQNEVKGFSKQPSKETQPDTHPPVYQSSVADGKEINSDLIISAPILKSKNEDDAYFPDEISMPKLDQKILQKYSRIYIPTARLGALKNSPLLQFYNVGHPVKNKEGKKIGNIIKIVGIGQLDSMGLEKSRISITQVFGEIGNNSKISSYIPLAPIQILGYSATPDKSIHGEIMYLDNQQGITQPFHYLLVDKGKASGFKLGDGVVFYSENHSNKNGKKTVAIGSGLVIRLADSQATVLVRDVSPQRLKIGDKVITRHSAQIMR